MGSAFAFFSGRRGEIVWKKERFMGGRGRRDYDTHWAIGFVAPLVVLEPLHTFHWSQQGAGRAVRLNPERAFRLRAYLQDWSLTVGFLLLVAAPTYGVVRALSLD